MIEQNKIKNEILLKKNRQKISIGDDGQTELDTAQIIDNSKKSVMIEYCKADITKQVLEKTIQAKA